MSSSVCPPPFQEGESQRHLYSKPHQAAFFTAGPEPDRAVRIPAQSDPRKPGRDYHCPFPRQVLLALKCTRSRVSPPSPGIQVLVLNPRRNLVYQLSLSLPQTFGRASLDVVCFCLCGVTLLHIAGDGNCIDVMRVDSETLSTMNSFGIEGMFREQPPCPRTVLV